MNSTPFVTSLESQYGQIFPLRLRNSKTDQTHILKKDNERNPSLQVIKRRNHPSNIMWMGGEEVYFTEAHVESGNKQLMEYIGEVTHQLTNTPYADASPLSSREASVWVMPQKNQCMRTHITMLPGQFYGRLLS